MAKRHYARLSRKLDKQSATNLIHRRKSQTVSGQSRKVLFVASPVLRKVQTASAQFNATKLRSLEQKATKITKNLDGIPNSSAARRCNSLGTVDRIVAIKNPDSVWRISQTPSAESYIDRFGSRDSGARRRAMKSAESKLARANLTFERLIEAVRDVHEQLRAQAGRAINVSLTLRNWLIGAYIAEYELRGTDRASYGENLLNELVDRLAALKVSNCDRRKLYRYLRFYRLYPSIVGTLSPTIARLWKRSFTVAR